MEQTKSSKTSSSATLSQLTYEDVTDKSFRNVFSQPRPTDLWRWNRVPWCHGEVAANIKFCFTLENNYRDKWVLVTLRKWSSSSCTCPSESQSIVRTLKMFHAVGGCPLLEIRKQPNNFEKWRTETVKLPYDWADSARTSGKHEDLHEVCSTVSRLSSFCRYELKRANC